MRIQLIDCIIHYTTLYRIMLYNTILVATKEHEADFMQPEF